MCRLSGYLLVLYFMKLKQELKFTIRNKMEIKTKEQVEGRFTQKFAEQANDVVVDEDEKNVECLTAYDVGRKTTCFNGKINAGALQAIGTALFLLFD